MKKCRCGHINQDEASFCQKCGKPLDYEKVCSQCFTKASLDDNYCVFCGAPLMYVDSTEDLFYTRNMENETALKQYMSLYPNGKHIASAKKRLFLFQTTRKRELAKKEAIDKMPYFQRVGYKSEEKKYNRYKKKFGGAEKNTRCLKCGHLFNPPAAKFCGKCGNSLDYFICCPECYAQGKLGEFCTTHGRQFRLINNPDDVAFARSIKSWKALDDYCDEFADGKHVKQARAIIQQFMDKIIERENREAEQRSKRREEVFENIQKVAYFLTKIVGG